MHKVSRLPRRHSLFIRRGCRLQQQPVKAAGKVGSLLTHIKNAAASNTQQLRRTAGSVELSGPLHLRAHTHMLFYLQTRVRAGI